MTQLKRNLNGQEGKIIVLLNGVASFANCLAEHIITLFKKSQHKGKCYRNINMSNYGINIFCDTTKLLKTLNNSTSSHQLLDSISVDHEQVFFSEVTQWKVVPTTSSEVRAMFLLRDPVNVRDSSIFNHFINLIMKQPFPKHQKEQPLPDVFVCVSVERDVIFFEEFLQALVNQDYSREKMSLHVTFLASTLESHSKYDVFKREIDSIRTHFK